MAKLLQRVDVTLRSFYIFNSQLSENEGEEHKKILYYYPSDIELNTKIKDVGLSEAIITFTSTFTTDESCKALHTQKTTQLFYQPEPGYWIVLVINVPKEIRSKDGVEVANYVGGEVHDNVYRAVLEQCYNMFRLFAGTFGMILQESGVAQLQERLVQFYDKHLLSLKLATCDVWDLIRSIRYLPLNKFLFLRAHNFINMICATFPGIKDTILLYNEQVVCSGKLDPKDLYSLHDYIVNGQLVQKSRSESDINTPAGSNKSGAHHDGLMTISADENCSWPPRIYLKTVDGGATAKIQAYNIIIFCASNATLCLLVDEHQADFYNELETYMSPQLSNLARDIGEEINNQQQQNVGKLTTANDEDGTFPKYLFINEQSLKHLSNFSIDRQRPKAAQSIPMSVMNLIADLRHEEDDAVATNSFEEVQVKTTNDFWIVKRRCNWRQYYVIICNSKATLLDVTLEAKRIFEQELTDYVFFDKQTE